MALALQGLLCLHTDFKISVLIVVYSAICNLIGIALNHWIALGSIVIFTILILPTRISYLFHLCHLWFLSLASFFFFRFVWCTLFQDSLYCGGLELNPRYPPPSCAFVCKSLRPHLYIAVCYACMCSVVSDSLQPYSLQPSRVLCPWNFQAIILEWVAISFSIISIL